MKKNERAHGGSGSEKPCMKKETIQNFLGDKKFCMNDVRALIVSGANCEKDGYILAAMVPDKPADVRVSVRLSKFNAMVLASAIVGAVMDTKFFRDKKFCMAQTRGTRKYLSGLCLIL